MKSRLFKRASVKTIPETLGRAVVASSLADVKKLAAYYEEVGASFERVKWASAVENKLASFLKQNTDLVPGGVASAVKEVQYTMARMAAQDFDSEALADEEGPNAMFSGPEGLFDGIENDFDVIKELGNETNLIAPDAEVEAATPKQAGSDLLSKSEPMPDPNAGEEALTQGKPIGDWDLLPSASLTSMIKSLSSSSEFAEDKDVQRAVAEMSDVLSKRSPEVEVEEEAPKQASKKRSAEETLESISQKHPKNKIEVTQGPQKDTVQVEDPNTGKTIRTYQVKNQPKPGAPVQPNANVNQNVQRVVQSKLFGGLVAADASETSEPIRGWEISVYTEKGGRVLREFVKEDKFDSKMAELKSRFVDYNGYKIMSAPTSKPSQKDLSKSYVNREGEWLPLRESMIDQFAPMPLPRDASAKDTLEPKKALLNLKKDSIDGDKKRGSLESDQADTNLKAVEKLNKFLSDLELNDLGGLKESDQLKSKIQDIKALSTEALKRSEYRAEALKAEDKALEEKEKELSKTTKSSKKNTLPRFLGLRTASFE
jgi:hypothetical protein